MAALTDGAAVAAWLGLPATQDNADKYEQAAAVADEMVRQMVTIPTTGTPAAEVLPESLKLAAAMLAARLARRSTTPTGIAQVSGDQVWYVARTDPEIQMLIAPWMRFAFA